MIKDRELFLGITTTSSSKLSRGSGAAGRLRDIVSGSHNGNCTLQQAWNTTGFMPTNLSQSGKRNSVKDFEYLKFLNDTILKDDVLKKFMQKAGEIEEAAGPAARSKSPKKKTLTPLERVQSIQNEFNKDPTKFQNCKNLDTLLQDPIVRTRENSK